MTPTASSTFLTAEDVLQRVSDPAALDGLAPGSVVITPPGRAMQRTRDGSWRFAGDQRHYRAGKVLQLGPVLLVWEPVADDDYPTTRTADAGDPFGTKPMQLTTEGGRP